MMERTESNNIEYSPHDHAHAPRTQDVDTPRNRRSRTASTPVVTTTNQLLGSLPADLFRQLQPSMRSVYLNKEQYLYMQDDKLDYVYFPETAVVSELRTLEDGRMVEIAIEGKEG